MPDGTFAGAANAEAAAESEIVVLCVPFRSQSETLTNLKTVLATASSSSTPPCRSPPRSRGRATRMLGVWQGSAAQQAAEMVPDGVRVVAALHTVSAPLLADLDHALDEDVLVCGDRARRQARRRRSIDGSRACARRRRAPRDGAHRRAADRAADRDQRALQDARRRQDHRPLTGRAGRRPGRRHRRREARPRDARRRRRRPRRDRQHGRRRRGLRRVRLARPRPRHVLARRPHRRARLGPARRHVRT